MNKIAITVNKLLEISKRWPKIRVSRNFGSGPLSVLGKKDVSVVRDLAKKVVSPNKEAIITWANNLPSPFKEKGIFLHKKWSQVLEDGLDTTGVISKKLKPNEKKAVNAITLGHEKAEIDYINKNINLKYLLTTRHNSPGVLLREHNIVKSLKGPGSKKAIKIFKELRDYEDIPINYGVSPRLSRHAIKNVTKNILKKYENM
jgi:hypothetical protein